MEQRQNYPLFHHWRDEAVCWRWRQKKAEKKRKRAWTDDQNRRSMRKRKGEESIHRHPPLYFPLPLDQCGQRMDWTDEKCSLTLALWLSSLLHHLLPEHGVEGEDEVECVTDEDETGMKTKDGVEVEDEALEPWESHQQKTRDASSTRKGRIRDGQ